ncbi:MAG: hypothetical protein WAZ48_11495, partial [Lysobacteraceae bacterium]
SALHALDHAGSLPGAAVAAGTGRAGEEVIVGVRAQETKTAAEAAVFLCTEDQSTGSQNA